MWPAVFGFFRIREELGEKNSRFYCLLGACFCTGHTCVLLQYRYLSSLPQHAQYHNQPRTPQLANIYPGIFFRGKNREKIDLATAEGVLKTNIFVKKTSQPPDRRMELLYRVVSRTSQPPGWKAGHLWVKHAEINASFVVNHSNALYFILFSWTLSRGMGSTDVRVLFSGRRQGGRKEGGTLKHIIHDVQMCACRAEAHEQAQRHRPPPIDKPRLL